MTNNQWMALMAAVVMATPCIFIFVVGFWYPKKSKEPPKDTEALLRAEIKDLKIENQSLLRALAKKNMYR